MTTPRKKTKASDHYDLSLPEVKAIWDSAYTKGFKEGTNVPPSPTPAESWELGFASGIKINTHELIKLFEDEESACGVWAAEMIRNRGDNK